MNDRPAALIDAHRFSNVTLTAALIAGSAVTARAASFDLSAEQPARQRGAVNPAVEQAAGRLPVCRSEHAALTPPVGGCLK